MQRSSPAEEARLSVLRQALVRQILHQSATYATFRCTSKRLVQHFGTVWYALRNGARARLDKEHYIKINKADYMSFTLARTAIKGTSVAHDKKGDGPKQPRHRSSCIESRWTRASENKHAWELPRSTQATFVLTGKIVSTDIGQPNHYLPSETASYKNSKKTYCSSATW